VFQSTACLNVSSDLDEAITFYSKLFEQSRPRSALATPTSPSPIPAEAVLIEDANQTPGRSTISASRCPRPTR